MAEMRIIHRVVLPTFSVEIRTSDGKLSVAHCEYLRGVVEILTTQAVEDNEKPRLLAALADAGLEPAALNEGIPRDLKEAAEAPAKVAEHTRDCPLVQSPGKTLENSDLCDCGYLPDGARAAMVGLRAKVAELEQRCGEQKVQLNYADSGALSDAEEIAELRATLAKVDAFFAEHGERITESLECNLHDWGMRGNGARCRGIDETKQALSAILATLPKGTKET